MLATFTALSFQGEMGAPGQIGPPGVNGQAVSFTCDQFIYSPDHKFDLL